MFINQSGGEVFTGKSILHIGRCVPEIDGSHWIMERVGPFQTFGERQQINAYWQDAFDVSALLKIDASVYIGETYAGPVHESDKRIPNPPLYHHHTHVSQGEGLNFRHTLLDDCVLHGICTLPNDCYVFQYHGDRQRVDAESDLVHFGEDYRQNVKQVVEPVSVSTTIMDVRPPNSVGLLWFYEASICLQKGSQKLLSVHTLNSLWAAWVPAAQDSFTYFTFRFPYDGTTARIIFHSHTEAFQFAWILTGTPKENGCDEFWHTSSFTGASMPGFERPSLITQELGFASNMAFRSYFFSVVYNHIICTFISQQQEEVLHSPKYPYDEAASRYVNQSCKSINFTKQRMFSYLSFHGPTPLGTASGTRVAMHYEVEIEYRADMPSSHYSYVYAGWIPNSTDVSVSRYDKARLIMELWQLQGRATLQTSFIDAAVISTLLLVAIVVHPGLAYTILIVALGVSGLLTKLYSRPRCQIRAMGSCTAIFCTMVSVTYSYCLLLGSLHLRTLHGMVGGTQAEADLQLSERSDDDVPFLEAYALQILLTYTAGLFVLSAWFASRIKRRISML